MVSSHCHVTHSCSYPGIAPRWHESIPTESTDAPAHMAWRTQVRGRLQPRRTDGDDRVARPPGSMAMPSLENLINGNRLANASNEVLAFLNAARLEAVTHHTRVDLCRSADGERCSGDAPSPAGWMAYRPEGDGIEVVAATRMDGRILLQLNQAAAGLEGIRRRRPDPHPPAVPVFRPHAPVHSDDPPARQHPRRDDPRQWPGRSDRLQRQRRMPVTVGMKGRRSSQRSAGPRTPRGDGQAPDAPAFR